MASTKSTSSESKSNSTSEYAALELANLLIQCISQDNSRKRNIMASEQILGRATAVYKAIRHLMKLVDDATDLATGWLNFQKYNAAIPPLEALLLNFTFTVTDDKPHLPSALDISGCLLFIAQWSADRRVVDKTLKALGEKHFKDLSTEIKTVLDADTTVHRRQDDFVALGALEGAIKKLNLAPPSASPPRAFTNIFQQTTTVKDNASRVLDTFKKKQDSISDVRFSKNALESAEIAIRTTMLVYAAFALLANDNASIAVRTSLKSLNIWKEAARILQNVASHLTDASPTCNELITGYEAFEKLLAADILLGPYLLRLIKLASTVRRPFYGRLVVLVQMSYDLNAYCNDPKNKSTGDRVLLKQALDEAETAIEEANRKASDTKSFLLDSNGYTEIETSFNTASSKMKECFEAYKMSTEWDKFKVKFDAAVKVDRDHFARAKERLGYTVPK
ncbi:hypothetical protein BDQ12DRAFT_750516 [Crucibulum laeve]|uniref:Uncharacterized protein n=1 Tax=Crucibulum laeve TaxID=68775 RepID=A0A5C3LYD3_9AGAR|nr:hypothetical protein BDQ12DRAFT_750516 [Crucibulum laeve]